MEVLKLRLQAPIANANRARIEEHNHMKVFAYIHTYLRVKSTSACARAHPCKHACFHVCVHIFMNPWHELTFVFSRMYPCIHACFRVIMSACFSVKISEWNISACQVRIDVCIYICHAHMHSGRYLYVWRECEHFPVHMLANRYARKYTCTYASIHACVYAYVHVCIHVCMHACTRVCMYACMHVSLCACECMPSHVTPFHRAPRKREGRGREEVYRQGGWRRRGLDRRQHPFQTELSEWTNSSTFLQACVHARLRCELLLLCPHTHHHQAEHNFDAIPASRCSHSIAERASAALQAWNASWAPPVHDPSCLSWWQSAKGLFQTRQDAGRIRRDLEKGWFWGDKEKWCLRRELDKGWFRRDLERCVSKDVWKGSIGRLQEKCLNKKQWEKGRSKREKETRWSRRFLEKGWFRKERNKGWCRREEENWRFRRGLEKGWLRKERNRGWCRREKEKEI